MKEMKIEGNFVVNSGKSFVKFIRKDTNLDEHINTIPDEITYYNELIIRYKENVGIARSGINHVSVSKLKEERRLVKILVLCDKFSWIEDRDELAKILI